MPSKPPPGPPKPPRKAAAKKATPAKRAPRKATPKPPPNIDPEQALASVTPLRRDKSQQGRNTHRHNPNNPAQLELLERRAKAYNMRMAGLTTQQIADQIAATYPGKWPNYSKQRVSDDVQAMRDEVVIVPMKEQLIADLERLNAMSVALWPTVMKGDPKAIHEMRGLLSDRAKYLGLYSPIRHVLTGADGGPVQLADLADPATAFAKAMEALDEVLPQVERKALPGSK